MTCWAADAGQRSAWDRILARGTMRSNLPPNSWFTKSGSRRFEAAFESNASIDSSLYCFFLRSLTASRSGSKIAFTGFSSTVSFSFVTASTLGIAGFGKASVGRLTSPVAATTGTYLACLSFEAVFFLLDFFFLLPLDFGPVDCDSVA